jgi:AcrR family transcriptional regulator
VEAPIAPSLRERKKQATRETIRKNTIRLALEKGLKDVTVEEISRESEVAPRTFFNYFACKEDAIISDNSQFVAEVKRAIVARPGGEAPLQAVRAVLGETIFSSAKAKLRQDMLDRERLIRQNPDLLFRRLVGIANLERAIADAVAERLSDSRRQDAYPALLAAVSVTVVRLTFRGWAEGDKALKTLFNKNFNRLERGLS